MKETIAVLFLLLITVQVICASNYCESDDDCNPTDCCATKMSFVGPRCLQRGDRGEGCSNEKHIGRRICPCQEGLDCALQPFGLYRCE